MSTDSEDLNGSVMERRRHKRHKAQRSQRADGKCLEEDSQPQKDAHKPEEEPAFSITKQQPQTSANKDNLVSENKTNVPGECRSWFSELLPKSFVVNHQVVYCFVV